VHFFLQQREDQQAVPGEQLRPGDDDHAQAKGEQEAGDRPGQAHVVHAVNGGVGGGAAQGDEGPRQNRQGQERSGALLRFHRSGGGIALQKFIGNKVMQDSTPFLKRSS